MTFKSKIQLLYKTKNKNKHKTELNFKITNLMRILNFGYKIGSD